MNPSNLEEFGKILVQKIRDEAIRSCDQVLDPAARGPVAKRWRLHRNDPKMIIADCVDNAIFHLLDAVDNGHIRLSYTTSKGETVDLGREGLGELGGLFMASGGWRSEYASERVNDDFKDLA